MRKVKALFFFAVTVAAVLIILLQHEQNRQLIQELASVREANARLESVQTATNSDQTQNDSQPKAVEEMQSELLRLRGVVSKAAGAQAENVQLRKELERLRAQTASGGVGSNSDMLSTYLGAPVETPPNLEPAYSKEGLFTALQVAAQKAGISLKKVTMDDSEFPFLTGVVCDPGDWEKLKAQLRNMEGYEFHGSVGDDTRNTFCIVPSRAFGGSSMQVNRRMNTRLQLFYDNFTAQ